MVTDEQLIDDLTRAFHDATSDLTYAGPVPRLRRGVGPALPVLAATAAAAVLVAVPVVAAQRGDAPSARQPEPVPASSSPAAARTGGLPSQAPQERTVTGTLRLAGYQIDLDRGTDGQVVAFTGVAIPADATSLAAPGKVEAFASTDAETGDPAVFVRVPLAGGRHRVFELTSAELTADQLAELLSRSHARTVPLVTR